MAATGARAQVLQRLREAQATGDASADQLLQQISAVSVPSNAHAQSLLSADTRQRIVEIAASHTGGADGGAVLSGDAERMVVGACQTDDVRPLREALDAQRVALTAVDTSARSLVHIAASFGADKIVAFLVTERHLPVDVRVPSTQQTPLHVAASAGHVSTLHALLGLRAELGVRDASGRNALHEAARAGHALCVHYLYAAGLSLESTDDEGHTPLMWAAYAGRVQVIMYLLARKVDVARADHNGCTALHWALNQQQFECVEDLVKAGAPLDAADKDGEKPLAMAHAVGHPSLSAFMEKYARVRAQERRLAQMPANLPLRILTWTPIVGVPFSWAVMGYLPWYLGLPIGLGLWPYMLKRSMWFLTVQNDFRNPALRSYFVMSCVWCGVVFAAHIAPALYRTHPLSVLAFAVLLPLTLWFYTVGMLKDPGTIPRPTQLSPDAIAHDVSTGALTSKGMCLSCMLQRPLRSKHDGKTDRCYVRFDHYCQWMNGPVAANNYREFFFCLVVQVAGQWVLLYLLAALAFSDPSATSLFSLLSSASSRHPYMFVLICHNSFHAVWLLLLLGLHLYFVTTNLTTNEWYNWGKYPHMKRDGRFVNPFRRSLVENVRFFAGLPHTAWAAVRAPSEEA